MRPPPAREPIALEFVVAGLEDDVLGAGVDEQVRVLDADGAVAAVDGGGGEGGGEDGEARGVAVAVGGVGDFVGGG